MTVKLIGITKPCIEGVNTTEDLIAYCARVSAPNNQLNTATAPKLVKYLMDNQHWSPLEMVSITMEIETTRDIARQILRHRSFSFQEFSQRYADASQLGFTTRECRMQDPKNRQNSLMLIDDPTDISGWWNGMQEHIRDAVIDWYREALQRGIAKEQARALLPEGLTMSRMYMAGTFRSWYHYCQLRMANGTQKEHQQIAQECWEVLKTQFLNTLIEEK